MVFTVRPEFPESPLLLNFGGEVLKETNERTTAVFRAGFGTGRPWGIMYSRGEALY